MTAIIRPRGAPCKEKGKLNQAISNFDSVLALDPFKAAALYNRFGQVESVASVVKIEGPRNRKSVTNYGLYELAFKLTLRKK